DPDEFWVKAAFVDRGPTKNRRRMRPAPQGRAYRERRHFCHVTVLLSNEDRAEAEGVGADGKASAAKSGRPAESKKRKRGGAVAAPRAKRFAKEDERKVTEPAPEESTEEKAGAE
ncbi:MAG TPA: uL22 family ribosomal protein, partial [Pyrinomonadaceae bacterium]|nr:uL22 family ribosomal protein [Pyrinomonadaceae bacterium]